MKRLNFNIKDRKILYMLLGIVLVSVFTLTVAYAALNAVLDISGSAQVSSAEWDVHFDNVKVTNGSVSGDDPRITSATTATFSAILNMPGDYYEFTIDVVNDGNIDAMIENVTKTPTLTSEQAKYLRYDITYQNGESITEKQLVERKSFVRLKVRLEYRSDITSVDLPTTSETLTLGLKLDYVQTDGSGSSIPVHGVGSGDVSSIEAYGSLEEVGTIVKIGTEYFYSLGVEGENVRLFAVYNLLVGRNYDSLQEYTTITGDGLQSSEARGLVFGTDGFTSLFPIIGVTEFSNNDKKGDTLSSYEGSVIEEYVNNYAVQLQSMGVNVVSSGLLHQDDIVNIFGCDTIEGSCVNSQYSWVYSTSYWYLGDSCDVDEAYSMLSDGDFSNGMKCTSKQFRGVRPVIVVPVDDIIPPVLIEFTVNDKVYQAVDGMTWGDWIDSKYNVDGFIRSPYDNIVYSSSNHEIRLDYSYVYVEHCINNNGSYFYDPNKAPAPTSN